MTFKSYFTLDIFYELMINYLFATHSSFFYYFYDLLPIILDFVIFPITKKVRSNVEILMYRTFISYFIELILRIITKIRILRNISVNCNFHSTMVATMAGKMVSEGRSTTSYIFPTLDIKSAY